MDKLGTKLLLGKINELSCCNIDSGFSGQFVPFYVPVRWMGHFRVDGYGVCSYDGFAERKQLYPLKTNMKNQVNKLNRRVNTPKVVSDWYRKMGRDSHRLQKKRNPAAYLKLQKEKARLGGLARWKNRPAK